jgi:hypothetical protein
MNAEGGLAPMKWLRPGLAGFTRRRSAAMQVHEKAAASFLLLAIVGAIALSLAAVRPAAAQDGQRSDGNDFVQEQRALSRPLFSSPPRYIQDGVQAIDTPNVENEIVYIDDQGFIRIFDPQTPPDMPPLNFRSPEGDGPWYDAAVDDLNGDGDDEIVAIAEDGVVTIYDPVVNLVITNPVQEYDGVYWELLFTTQVAGEPLLVTTGEFDDNPATREIVVVFADPDNANATRIQIFVQPAAPFDGRTWIPLTDVRFGAIATAITSGDLDGDGRDDLAVVASGVGRLSILRRDVNNVLSTYWSSISDSRPWTDAAIGQVATDSALPELAAVRSAAPPLASLVVQRYIPVDEFEDVLLRDHLPAPRQVILANVTGASTQQIFMLRNVPSNDTRPRLFNSRTGSGANLIFEVRLDSDNGYRVAAAGDLDGDGKDEIAVLRDSGILIFTEPASSTTLTQTLTAPTNQRTLALGNLDALGRDLLSSTPSSLSFVVPAGERSAAQTITLSNRTRTNQIPYTVGVAPAVRFVAATPAAGATRAEIAV